LSIKFILPNYALINATYSCKPPTMKKPLFVFALLLTCPLLQSAQTASNEADMHTFARKFMAAYNQGDHAALGKMYTADADRIDIKGKKTKGADNISNYYAEQFRLNNVTLLIRQNGLHWSDYEHAWVATGTYEVYGKSVVYDIDIDFAGQYTNTMLEQKGEWKIAKSVLQPLAHKDPKVAANIKLYTETWDAIINEGRFELFNEEHFMPNVVMHAEPENIVGIEGMKGYYQALLSAFSDGQFTVNNIFGEGDQLTKHWTFRGRHTGDFFGIPASGNEVVMTGSTIVRMSPDGRIAEEQDFMDYMAILLSMRKGTKITLKQF
jgi:predicted ester cyclase/ketosteroid isomerase-like protein